MRLGRDTRCIVGQILIRGKGKATVIIATEEQSKECAACTIVAPIGGILGQLLIAIMNGIVLAIRLIQQRMRTLSAIGEANVANILKQWLTEKQDVIKIMSIMIPTISNLTSGGNSISVIDYKIKSSPTELTLSIKSVSYYGPKKLSTGKKSRDSQRANNSNYQN